MSIFNTVPPLKAGKGMKFDGETFSTAAAPRNLLDNSDFRNTVNQRGQTSYTGEYGIDRWRTWNSDTLTVSSGYITVNGYVYQYFLPTVVRNSIHTLVAKKTDGSIMLYTKNPHDAFSYANNSLGLGLDNETVVAGLPTGSYLWAALYEGEYTAETLPEYRCKGYWAELAECQRYYEKINIHVASPIGFGYSIGSGTSCRIRINYKVKRIVPTTTFNLTESGVVCAGKYVTINQISSVNAGTSYCLLILSTTEAAPREAAVMYADGSYEISCDL